MDRVLLFYHSFITDLSLNIAVLGLYYMKLQEKTCQSKRQSR